jgi:predicted HAD superfamily hydrolase
MNTKSYSFDIFDTCLVRIWAKPSDLFWELGCQLSQENLIEISPPEWQSLRIKAELLARESLSHGEVTIEEIYKEFETLLGWSSSERKYAAQKELDLEISSLRVIPPVLKRISALRAEEKRILYISDMYLPEDDIRSMLRDKGVSHPEDAVYVSSRWKLSKSTGRLFQHCLDQELIAPSDLIHLGDNHHSDVAVAKRLGISSELFDESHLNRYENILAASNDLPIKFRSLLAGISRLTRLHAPSLSPAEKIIWDTSVNAVAPALFGFVYWCLTEAQKKGIQRLYFVARDGQILQQIAKVICENWGFHIDCRYLYGSRQSWHFPAILQIGEMELDWIFDPTNFLSVSTVCSRVNLEPTQISDSLILFGFEEENWNLNLTSSERTTLREVFKQKPVVDLIIRISEDYRNKAIGYFRQEGITDPVKFAIVDIGWHGRLQCSFSKLLSSAGIYPHEGLTGFYFALSKRIQVSSTDKLYAYFSDPDYISSRDNLCQFRALFELFMTADHGGTMKFEYSSGKYFPVLRFQENTKAINWGLLIQQKSICEFTQQITKNLNSEEFSNHSYLLAASEILLREFISQPSFLEAETYGKFLFAEDQAETKMYELAPKYELKDCLRLLTSGLHPHHNVWFSASKVRSNVLSRMLLHQKTPAVGYRIQSLKRNLKKFILKKGGKV